MQTASEELEPQVEDLQKKFLSIGEMDNDTDQFLRDLDRAGVTEEALILVGLCVSGSVLCRADGTEIIADLGDGGSWPYGVRNDRAVKAC